MNSSDIDPPSSNQPPAKSFRAALLWIWFNLFLLASYIGFFHLCLITEFPVSMVIGFVIAAVMAFLCFRNYALFTNRYEFWFYLALPLDVALESLIPFHSGFSFYWCAASFWSVFVIYRVYRLVVADNTTSTTA